MSARSRSAAARCRLSASRSIRTRCSSTAIGLEDVRAALAATNANSPKGAIEEGERRYQIYTNDQARTADDYRPLIIAYRNGAPVRLSDVADVIDSVEDVRNQGLANGHPSVLVIIYRQPGANIIETVQRIRSLLPQLQRQIPRDIDIKIASDRSDTIRASLHAVEIALVIAIVLVITVVLFFLGDVRAALIPSVAVPVSLIGTFGVMYLLGLQPEQSVADGADRRHRLRRRRRRGRAGEHHAAHRGGNVAPPGDAAGSAGGRLYRRFR